jgi:hypothetical protein
MFGDDTEGDDPGRKAVIESILGTCYVGSGSENRYTAPAPTAGTAARKVWDYVMVNGPYGSVNRVNVSFTSNSNSGYLTSTRPTSTVALASNNATTGTRADIALDAERRILFIGSVNLFGTISGSTYNDDYVKFIGNIVAFMVNAAQYGEYFLSDFK